jgi:hypothetical protein
VNKFRLYSSPTAIGALGLVYLRNSGEFQSENYRNKRRQKQKDGRDYNFKGRQQNSDNRLNNEIKE